MFGQPSRRQRFIAAHAFNPALVERFGVEHPEIAPDDRSLVFDGLRQWFAICLRAKGDFVAMPSIAVDGAWHEFILFTRDYMTFCDRAIGRFLHHSPTSALPKDRSELLIEDGFFRTWELACRDEGMDPATAERLPVIFAIDERVRVEGGAHYDLNLIRSEWRTRSGRPWWPPVTGATQSATLVGGCGTGGAGFDGSGGCGGGGCGGGCGGGG